MISRCRLCSRSATSRLQSSLQQSLLNSIIVCVCVCVSVCARACVPVLVGNDYPRYKAHKRFTAPSNFGANHIKTACVLSTHIHLHTGTLQCVRAFSRDTHPYLAQLSRVQHSLRDGKMCSRGGGVFFKGHGRHATYKGSSRCERGVDGCDELRRRRLHARVRLAALSMKHERDNIVARYVVRGVTPEL